MTNNKLLLSILLFGILVSTSAIADEFTGFRIGAGISETSISVEGDDDGLWKYDSGNGFKLEYGYDFNQVIGIGISYETNDDRVDGIKYEGQSTKLSFDIGTAFPVQNAFLKPYGKVGFMYYSEESSLGTEFDDDNLFVGLGVRFQHRYFYTDLSLDYYLLDGEFEYLDVSLTQTALTAGYKF